MKRIVLTGGPGVGKSATLDALRAMGMNTASDAARDVIRERLAQGLSPRPAPVQFAQAVLARDIRSYEDASTERDSASTFYERGVVDAVGGLWGTGGINSAQVDEFILNYPYSQPVFIFPPWPEIYKTDAERDQTFTESVGTYQRIHDWYTKNNYRLLEVPKDTPERRAEFIAHESGLA